MYLLYICCLLCSLLLVFCLWALLLIGLVYWMNCKQKEYLQIIPPIAWIVSYCWCLCICVGSILQRVWSICRRNSDSQSWTCRSPLLCYVCYCRALSWCAGLHTRRLPLMPSCLYTSRWQPRGSWVARLSGRSSIVLNVLFCSFRRAVRGIVRIVLKTEYYFFKKIQKSCWQHPRVLVLCKSCRTTADATPQKIF